MMMLPSDLKVFVARDPVDMRKGFNGLNMIIQSTLKQDPQKSALFVFFNKPRDKVKIMYWDRNGFPLWYKQLAEGRFRPPQMGAISYTITLSDLNCLLEGIDLLSKQRLKSL